MFATPARVLWLYGLSGAGKTTLARQVADEWRARGGAVAVLDGDDLRSGVSSDLAFTDTGRTENIRRAAEMAAMLCRQGINVVAALVTPLREQREMVRRVLQGHPVDFYWVNTPLETCQKRDPGGLYTRAASGELQDVAGLDLPFEEPGMDLPDRTLPGWAESNGNFRLCG
ncbi:MAG TPA: adenylyl-sulfate kinase [Prosthecobacter sp.]